MNKVHQISDRPHGTENINTQLSIGDCYNQTFIIL